MLVMGAEDRVICGHFERWQRAQDNSLLLMGEEDHAAQHDAEIIDTVLSRVILRRGGCTASIRSCHDVEKEWVTGSPFRGSGTLSPSRARVPRFGLAVTAPRGQDAAKECPALA